jgi:methylated-DNA-[protein]-cysteine S-methyltransferase
MIGQISIKTKFGWINATEEKGRIIEIKFGKRKINTINKNLKKFRSSLNNYLSKKNKSISCKILLKGNSTQKKIWKELKKIRFGKTKTYGEIAKKFKLSPRYIGKICGQNKIVLVIPCHRVIRSDSTLGGFSSPGGIKLKKKLLDFEKN